MRGAAAGNGAWSFTVVGAGFGWFVRCHLTACGVMLAGQARLAAGSMRACHEVISDGEGRPAATLTDDPAHAAGDPGPLAQAQAGRVGWHQIARLARRGCAPGAGRAPSPLTGRRRAWRHNAGRRQAPRPVRTIKNPRLSRTGSGGPCRYR